MKSAVLSIPKDPHNTTIFSAIGQDKGQKKDAPQGVFFLEKPLVISG